MPVRRVLLESSGIGMQYELEVEDDNGVTKKYKGKLSYAYSEDDKLARAIAEFAIAKEIKER